MWVSTTKLARLEGVTTQTIRRRIESGHYGKVKQTEGGHFRVFITEQKVICYARVSSSKQTFSIEKQREILLERYPDATFISDIASAWLPQKIDFESMANTLPFAMNLTHQKRGHGMAQLMAS